MTRMFRWPMATTLACLLASGASAQGGPEGGTGQAPDPAATSAPPLTPGAIAAPESAAAPAVSTVGAAEPVATPVATEAEVAASWGDWAETASSGGDDAPIFEARFYGFIDAYFEQVAKSPARDADDPTKTVYESNPYEFDVANLHAMVQGSIFGRYRFFLNLAAPGAGSASDDEGLAVRNAWVEAPILPGILNVRAGKTYRRFGLYNEILDAVPTFIGIEPPEMFDKDHLLLTRTTNLMLFGSVDAGPATIHYSLSTGNEERTNDAIPIGVDVYADISDWLRIGSSFYTTGGDAAPTRGVGEGSPRGGVLNWMEKDQFTIFGGYAQIMHDSGFIAQVEYWQADHDGVRDVAALQDMAASGSLHGAQMRRFFVGGDPTAAKTQAKYSVRTAYIRLGYELALDDVSSLTPYVQADYYSNPETVADKDLGGDNEAGIADDGKFQKYTVGAVYRPVSQVALKLDASGHVQKFNGATEFYPEVRVSFSYLWGL